MKMLERHSLDLHPRFPSSDSPRQSHVHATQEKRQDKRRESAKQSKSKDNVLPKTIAGLGRDGAVLGEEKDKDEGAEHPFELNNLKFVILQGAFVAIIGCIGCGKVQINLLAIR